MRVFRILEMVFVSTILTVALPKVYAAVFSTVDDFSMAPHGELSFGADPRGADPFGDSSSLSGFRHPGFAYWGLGTGAAEPVMFNPFAIAWPAQPSTCIPAMTGG